MMKRRGGVFRALVRVSRLRSAIKSTGGAVVPRPPPWGSYFAAGGGPVLPIRGVLAALVGDRARVIEVLDLRECRDSNVTTVCSDPRMPSSSRGRVAVVFVVAVMAIATALWFAWPRQTSVTVAPAQVPPRGETGLAAAPPRPLAVAPRPVEVPKAVPAIDAPAAAPTERMPPVYTAPDATPSTAPRPAAPGVTPTAADVEAARKALIALLQQRLRLETLIAKAIDALVAGEYERSEELAGEVTRIEPDNQKALELAATARSMRHESLHSGPSETRPFQAWIGNQQETTKLDTLLLQWPSVAFWNSVVPLQETLSRDTGLRGDDRVRSLLDTALVTIVGDNLPLVRVARDLQAMTALDVIADEALRKMKPPYAIGHLDLHDRTLREALDALSASGDLAWRVEHGGVRIVAKTSSVTGAAGPALKLQYFDIRDLVAAADSPSGRPFASTEALVAALQLEVEPESWRSAAGESVRGISATLVVRATESTLESVRGWLERKRKK
jgi:hypothetical protein